MPSAIPDRSVVLAVLSGLALAGASVTTAPLLAQATVATSSGTDTIPTPRDVAGRPVGVLRQGDVVNVIVFRNKELSGEFLIDTRGNIQIPGLAEIPAAGVAPTEMKERIRAVMMRHGFEDPDLAVLPLLRVSVLGEVRKPGAYPVEPGTSLLQLLTLAGGPSETADLRKARVVREGRAFGVDLQSALGGSASGRVVLYSNDVLVVPKRGGLTRERLGFLLTGATTAVSLINLIIALRN